MSAPPLPAPAPATAAPEGKPTPACPAPRQLSWRSRLLLAQLLALAGAIHLLLTPQHLAERPAYGIFFAIAATWQLRLAGILALRPHPPGCAGWASGAASPSPPCG